MIRDCFPFKHNSNPSHHHHHRACDRGLPDRGSPSSSCATNSILIFVVFAARMVLQSSMTWCSDRQGREREDEIEDFFFFPPDEDEALKSRRIRIITPSQEDLKSRYQGPIPADQVKQWTEYDYEGQGPPSTRGSRRGRGRGRGRGNYSNGVMEYNADGGLDGGRGYGVFDGGHGYGGFEGGRGYAGRGQSRGRVCGYRGRGRGYGSGSMQTESFGYTIYNDSAQIRGRERGRGRARGGGRGGGGRLDGPIQSVVYSG